VSALVAGLGIAAPIQVVMPGTAMAQQAGEVPGDSLGGSSDTDFWRAVRQGQQFTVSIPDKKAGC
jgi:formate dehydrogenase subunit gamma